MSKAAWEPCSAMCRPSRVSAMDAAGYFEEPVTEDQAPGYGKVIKHPMCFQVGT